MGNIKEAAVLVLLVVLYFYNVAHTWAADGANKLVESRVKIDFAQAALEAEKSIAAPTVIGIAGIQENIDPLVQKSYVEASVAYYEELENFYGERSKYYGRAWANRLDAFSWQHTSSQITFWVVILLIAFGLYLSWKEFQTGSKQPSVIKISKDGFEMSSSVLGLFILAFSLCFFYLYLAQVYPISTIGDQPDVGRQAQTDTQESSTSE